MRMTARRMWTSISGTPSVGVQRDEDEIDELDEDERDDDPAHSVDPDIPPQDGRRAGGPELHPTERQRDERHNERALKMTAESTALWGLCNFMMLRGSSCGYVARNKAGMMAKYLATSLAMENVVSEPRVMRSCFPISTTSMSLVGFESRSTMFPASLAAWFPCSWQPRRRPEREQAHRWCRLRSWQPTCRPPAHGE